MPVEPDVAFEEIDAAKVVVVCDMSKPIDCPPSSLYDRESAWLKCMHDQGALVASVCSGSPVLAESGPLDGLKRSESSGTSRPCIIEVLANIGEFGVQPTIENANPAAAFVGSPSRPLANAC